MIVSHAHKFIFFHNPKCAGTSLREVLAPYHDDAVPFCGIHPASFFCNRIDHAHLRLWELQALFPRVLAAARSYRSLIFVRNPYQRFISAVDEHFHGFRRSLALEKQSPAAQILAIETFIDTFDVRLVVTDYRYVHFSPQLWFIRLGDEQVPSHILPIDDQGTFMARAFEHLGLAPQDVGRRNRSQLKLAHAIQSPKIAAFVRRFYALDFDFFGADPALRHLTEPPVLAAGHGSP